MTELSYTIHGDYAIPNLKLSNPADQPIGKYDRMRKRYLEARNGGFQPQRDISFHFLRTPHRWHEEDQLDL